MAVTLKEIDSWLSELDYKHEVADEKIIMIFGDSDSTYGLYFSLGENGKLFQAHMYILEEDWDNKKFKDHEHIGLILQHLLYLNYKTKFGTWEFDPSDGEVRLAVEIPLEDAKMTKAQLERIMSLFMKNGDEHADEILEIAKTGKIPEKDSEDAQMRELIEMLLKEAIASKKPDTYSDGI